MPGLESLAGVWDVKAIKRRPRENEARELLQKIADQVIVLRRSNSLAMLASSIQARSRHIYTMSSVYKRPVD